MWLLSSPHLGTVTVSAFLYPYPSRVCDAAGARLELGVLFSEIADEQKSLLYWFLV